MNHLQALYRLQTIETALDDAKERLAEIEIALMSDERLNAAQANLEGVQADQTKAEATVNDLSLELESLDQKRAEAETLLYSGQITNPREVDDKKQEVESLGRRREVLDEDLTSARNQLSGLGEALTEAQSQLADTQTLVAEANEELVTEQDTLRKQMAEWLRKRKDLLKRIKAADTTYYKMYKHVKAKKGGVAVARLEGDMCSVCHSQQTITVEQQVRQANDLVNCSNCGRILVEV